MRRDAGTWTATKTAAWVEAARPVGMEAVAGHLEQVALHEHPALVPAIATTPRKGQEYHHQYAPGMDWASRVKAGASVSTASLVPRATFLIGDDPGRSRLDGWFDPLTNRLVADVPLG